MPPKRYGKRTKSIGDQAGHENDIPGDLDEEETSGRWEMAIINFSEMMSSECLGRSLVPLIDTLALLVSQGR